MSDKLKVIVTPEMLGGVMQDAWGEICDDSGAHPLDIERIDGKTWYSARHWTDLIALRLNERLASLRTPTPEQAGEVVSRDTVLDTIRHYRDNSGGSASYRQACNHLIEAISVQRASTPPAQPTADAVERVAKIIRDNVGGALMPLPEQSRKAARLILEGTTMAGDYVMVPRADALAQALCLLDTFAGEGMTHTYGNGQVLDAADVCTELAEAYGIECEPGWWRTVADRAASRTGGE